ncbi:MAG: polysaccharide deacetylase family protein [Fibrobacterota bacterium]|nr:polysaccharide deacetylase family protein [Fibrobacterota bacterium]QQS05187.1 MAG: polysaccharide deacetylase family protein [Fibrobacterota bacterium]
MNPRKSFQAGSLIVLASAALTQAGPVTTVPWNGNTGAFSFTYDDARNTQIPNLIPQADGLGIKVTFFITNMYSFPSAKADWIKAAKNGHELANHTSDHGSPSNSNVSSMASTLRALDPSVDAVTFAYPNCSVAGTSSVSAESFMGRGCGQATYAWDKAPGDWMNVQGLIINAGAPTPGVNLVNSAKSGNSWGLTIVHDVGPNPDQYSLTVADNKKMLDAAVAAKVWVAPYATVGAYYRAHFVMDAVTASGSGPWKLTWTSPHPKMPKVVKLRVKLAAATFGDAVTVTQGGTAIQQESDGSFVIDFMKLSMDVQKGGSSILNEAKFLTRANVQVSRTGSLLKVAGLPQGSYSYSLRTLTGHEVGSGSLSSQGPSESAEMTAPLGRSGLVLVLRNAASVQVTAQVPPAI